MEPQDLQEGAAQRAVPAVKPTISGARRLIATALLSVGMMAVGGVAIVNAASPAPSSAAPAATAPAAGSGTQAPPANGANCPNM
ncbi:MAG: hypothetical protein ACRDGI_09120 [Candidatus Limnocylindrales bacterium]